MKPIRLFAFFAAATLLLPFCGLLPFADTAEDTFVMAVDSVNGTRWADMICVYKDRPSTLQNEWGWNIVVSAEGIATEITMEDYANSTPKAKRRYDFKESVLVTTADISLVFGLFLTAGTLIAPSVMEFELPEYTVTMISVCTAIVLFACTIVSWALLRCIADISRRTRLADDERSDK